MASTDEQLVAGAQSGDPQAFDALVSRYRSRVYYLALSILGCRDSAMDIVQDAFVQAYLSLRTLRSPGKFGSWLMMITRNLCLMHLRRYREIALPEEYLQRAVWEEPESDVLPILDDLPEGTRSAALLYFVEEMNQKEIAEFLGISLPAVKSRIRGARVRLQKEMIDMVRKSAPGDEFNKSLQQKLELARWYREFADLLVNGIPILQALDDLGHGDFSEGIREASLKIKEALPSGARMSDVMKLLPALCVPQSVGMVRAGEVGGILDWTLEFLADWIEVECSQRELELAFWCRTSGAVIAAGAPIKLSLESAFEVLRDDGLKRASRALAEALESGKPPKPVLAKHADVLPPVVRISILAGSKAGILGYTLQWAANAVHARMAERLVGKQFQPSVPRAPWLEQRKDAFSKAVAEYLGDESPAMRAAAVSIIGGLGLMEYVEKAVTLLSDEDAVVRKAAVEALATARFPCASPVLAKSLEDTDPLVRRAAVHAIYDLRLHDLAPALAKQIADRDPRVSNAATHVLEWLGEIDILTRRAIELLDDEWSLNRMRATWILAEHPNPDAIDRLVAHTRDDIWQVIGGAARALMHLDPQKAVPGLVHALECPHQHYLQRIAAEVLAEIGDPSAATHIRKAIAEGRLNEGSAWTAEKLEALPNR